MTKFVTDDIVSQQERERWRFNLYTDKYMGSTTEKSWPDFR
jgi:hypothetical protein